MTRPSASAIAWVARCNSAGLDEATRIGSSVEARKRPSGMRLATTGRMIAPVLAASVAGPAGRVVQASKSLTGMSSGRYPQSTMSASISPRRSTP